MLKLSSEGIFHTVQGEGKYVGYPSIFLRLNGCNLRCAWANPDGSITTCDTPHTSFNPEAGLVLDVQSVLDMVLAIDCEHVVVTGGEPYMQKEVVDLIDKLVEAGRFVTVETNGSLFRETKASFPSISLKLSTSSAHPELGKRHEAQRLKYDSLAKYVVAHENFQFKFVLNDQADVKEIEDIIAKLRVLTGKDINKNVWVMPQGIVTGQLDEKMKWLVDLCKQKNWKLSDRLHIRIFGHMRGV